MHFKHHKDNGSWTARDVPGGAIASHMDQTLFKCVNGDQGGTWNPSTPWRIGGQGIGISPLVAATIPFGETLIFEGEILADFDGSHTGSLTMSAGTITALFGATTFQQDAKQTNVPFVEEPGGRYVPHIVTAPDADVFTYSVLNARRIMIPTLTALRGYEILTAGAVAGDVIHLAFDLSQPRNSNAVLIFDDVIGALGFMGTNIGAVCSFKIVFNGVHFIPLSWSVMVG